MEIPCKECIVYAICQYKSIWELVSTCTKFNQYIRADTQCDYPHPWTRTLRSFQKKGES